MNKNLQSPSKLTEFAPLQPEEKQQSVTQIISKFFKFGKSVVCNEISSNSLEATSEEALPSWAIDKGPEQSTDSVVYNVDVAEGRSLPNVLKRISNLLALKSNNLQTYSDSELKQYWMPDSVSKECYECCEKFTTFRRRHHCRVCGQIFCSSCCNQQIPGKIFGCTGDLRVCTYCCKVVLSYLQSSDIGVDLSADLKALQENLQNKYGQSSLSNSIHQTIPSSSANLIESTDVGGSLKRKISVGYQEEKFASGRANVTYLTSEEKYRALQNSTSLRNLFEEIRKPNTGVILRTHRYRLRTYTNCLLGSELVDWLIYQQKANNRIQAAAICQALLDGGYITCVFESLSFIDGFVLYKLGAITSPELPLLNSTCETNNQDEPSWMQFVPQDSSTTDSDNDQVSSTVPCRITSSSSYTLDLNVGASTVYLSRPPVSSLSLHSEESDFEFDRHNSVCTESALVRTSEQREFVPESGWHNASHLREENGEKIAYNFLTNAFSQHENSLLKQLLSAEGLSLTWSDVLLSLIHEIVDVIRPDVNHNAEDLDIRGYVKFKKIIGGARENCELVRGVVFNKNVVHKNMSIKVENPKILLLEGSIVYQRTEGRLMSLEPVIMQEHEFLRNVAARIIALEPNIVLVQRNVSRLAQDILREQGISLVINVKQKVLERIARCTQADLVTSVDAHIGRPRLGTCKKFYIKSYSLDNCTTKTLMFFEGLPNAHLGATVLLRGASRSDLISLKKVASLLLFACYNWRLEKSFLMDEFAFLPNTKYEFFDETRESSPVESEEIVNKDEVKVKSEIKIKILAEEKKSISEAIKDFSDPLHSYNNVFNEKDQKLAVADLPFSNQFRKALDDTILCISPYVVFLMPYLETENGKKCKLRNFFPLQIYFSDQFDNKKKTRIIKTDGLLQENNNTNLKAPHPFVTTKLSTSTDSNEIQTLLSDYRARGGRLVKKASLVSKSNHKNDAFMESLRPVCIDVLDPRNHQRMAVLFCSFSHESSNAPAFCVNPWVVYMDFYGQNDIPLGCFLERYCFRSSYMCQSKCDTPMLKHIRRFVHFSGCVSISLNTLDTESPEENIVMWSWCSKCSSVSPVVPMSTDTWSFSFAKYLELRFHGGIYTRRGTSPCQHSLHHDHYQYFAYKNTVASFKYTVVQLWEISLPSLIIEINHNMSKQQADLIEETKTLALKGHDIFSIISDKLSMLPADEEVTINYRQQATKEQQIFKQKIEEIQLKLTSPTIENKDVDYKNPNSEIQAAVWRINDALIRIKRMLTETVDQWNTKLSETIHKKEERKKDKQLQQEVESPSTMESKNFDGSDVESKEDNSCLSKKNPSLDNCDEETKMLLPKGHSRSQSQSGNVQIEDSFDGKKEVDRKSVKTIFSLFSSSSLSAIASPFNPQDHFLLPSGVYAPIVVYESEPSSIVAYALNSSDYKKKFDELFGKKVQNPEQTPSPIAKRKSQSDRSENGDYEKSTGLLSFLRNKDTEQTINSQVSESVSSEKAEDSRKMKIFHIEVQFEDASSNFFCRIFYAEKFANIRKTVLPAGEEAFVRSLSRSVQWNARGGKSGSTFCKTTDDRFILKEMSKSEVQSFLDSANNYFTYMQRCFMSRQATLLGKILGIYQIIYRNGNTNATLRTYLLVMENLFYNRIVTQKFDLKGSMRNRLVNPDNQDGEIVLLDENLLKMTCDSPLYILPHSKAVLTNAILNDTEFLSTQSVMDYSLLVGLDTEKKELVLGIIDYIRTFTWDKRLETIVKKTGLLGGQGKLPTIMPPQEYQKRFIEAMHRYFLEVPDPWAGLGKL